MDNQQSVETVITQLRANFLQAIEECVSQMVKEKEVALYEGLNPMFVDNEIRKRTHNFNVMLKQLYVGREDAYDDIETESQSELQQTASEKSYKKSLKVRGPASDSSSNKDLKSFMIDINVGQSSDQYSSE